MQGFLPRYCTSVLKHISDVSSIAVAESVHALCHASKQSNMTHRPTGIIGYLHDVDSEFMKAFSFLSS